MFFFRIFNAREILLARILPHKRAVQAQNSSIISFSFSKSIYQVIALPSQLTTTDLSPKFYIFFLFSLPLDRFTPPVKAS